MIGFAGIPGIDVDPMCSIIQPAPVAR